MSEPKQVITANKAGFVNPASSRDNRRARIEAEEAALKELIEGKQEDGETDETDEGQDLPEAKEDQTEEKVSEGAEPGSPEERTFKKRYGDLRRHTDELKKQLKALEEGGGSKTITPPKSDEDLEAWMKQYPEVASIVTTIAKKEASDMMSDTKDKFAKLEEERAEFNRSQAENTIKKSHSDFDKLRDSEEFHNWVGDQSKWVQDALYENSDDPRAVISVIDLYKLSNGLTVEAKKTKQREAATAVESKTNTKIETKGKDNFSESQVKRNSDEWFSRNAQAIDEAMREGRFDYDLSGGAR